MIVAYPKDDSFWVFGWQFCVARRVHHHVIDPFLAIAVEAKSLSYPQGMLNLFFLFNVSKYD